MLMKLTARHGLGLRDVKARELYFVGGNKFE